MQRETVVLVVGIVILASGCSGLSGAGDAERTPTLTAVPVPDVTTEPRDASAAPKRCIAPAVAPLSESQTETPPSHGRLREADAERPGNVSGAVLVARHAARLANYSYQLRIGDRRAVTATAGGRAFTFSGFVASGYATTAFAVGGTTYVRMRAPDGTNYHWRRPVRAPSNRSLLPALTGRAWLADVIGHYNYTVTGTRTWNGSTVRVLEATLETPATLEHRRVLTLHSTVYVDRRGIVRYVDHYERVAYDTNSGPSAESQSVRARDETFRIVDLGTVRLRRPDDFCGIDENESTPGRPPILATATAE